MNPIWLYIFEVGFAGLPTFVKIYQEFSGLDQLTMMFADIFGSAEAFIFSFILYGSTFLEFLDRDDINLRSFREPGILFMLIAFSWLTGLAIVRTAELGGDALPAWIALSFGTAALIFCTLVRISYGKLSRLL